MNVCLGYSKQALRSTGMNVLWFQRSGLAGRKNGELLTLAEGKFDVFVTIDKNIRYQQNLSGRKIAILIIRARSSEIDDLLRELPACIVALQSIQPGQFIQVTRIIHRLTSAAQM